MRCFYHPDTDAVAGCKNCSRGLCTACAVDVGNGIACRGRCEEEVRALNRIIAQNKLAYEKARSAYWRTSLFYATLAVVFLMAGLADWRGFGWVLLPASGILALSAWLYFSTGREYTPKG
jgi:uncharacterized membrane protein YedE/YeeE